MKRDFEHLSPGARRVLKLFQWFWKQCGSEGCFPRVGVIAVKLKTSPRSVCRWTAELAAAGAIGKRRRGPHSNLYTSRGHLRCAQMQLPGLEDQPVGPEVGMSFGNSLPVVSINDLPELKENQEPKPEPENPTPPPPQEITEIAAVAAAVQKFQYADGSKPDSRLVAPRLVKIGQHYGVSGYILGEKLNQVKTQVDRSPSTAPRGPAWFVAVVETHCKRHQSAKPAESCVPRQPDKPPNYPPEDYCPEFGNDLIRGLLTTNLLAPGYRRCTRVSL